MSCTRQKFHFPFKVQHLLLNKMQLLKCFNAVHQVPLSMGFPRQEYWSGGAISSSRGSSPTQRSNLHLLHWRADFSLLSHLGSPKSRDSQERLHSKEWESLRVGSWNIYFQQVLQNELLMLPLEFMKYRLLRHSAPYVSLVLIWLCLFSKVRV